MRLIFTFLVCNIACINQSLFAPGFFMDWVATPVSKAFETLLSERAASALGLYNFSLVPFACDVASGSSQGSGFVPLVKEGNFLSQAERRLNRSQGYRSGVDLPDSELLTIHLIYELCKVTFFIQHLIRNLQCFNQNRGRCSCQCTKKKVLDLINLIEDRLDENVEPAIDSYEHVFDVFPDKSIAFQDLLRLAGSPLELKVARENIIWYCSNIDKSIVGGEVREIERKIVQHQRIFNFVQRFNQI